MRTIPTRAEKRKIMILTWGFMLFLIWAFFTANSRTPAWAARVEALVHYYGGK